MDAIAVAISELPLVLIEKHQLSRFIYERGGEKEFRFMKHMRKALLPIRHEGVVRLVQWGCPSGKLPRSGFTWLQTIENGEWVVYEAEEVQIIANAGLHNGRWYVINQGIRGLIATAGGETAAYMIVEPISHYYDILTSGANHMPVLINQRI